jgi:transposase-like protein
MEPRGDSVLEDPKPDTPVSTAVPAQVRPFPRCPNCGWQDVRFSYTRNALDALLGMISVQRFKCRSCGSYFRRRYRAPV